MDVLPWLVCIAVAGELEGSLPSWAKGKLDDDSDEDLDNPLSQYTYAYIGAKTTNVDSHSSRAKEISTSELLKKVM